MDDIANLTFEQAMQELESIVRRLEEGQVSLEVAISSYERGSALKKHCEAKLQDAKMRVEKIVMNADGSISQADFSPES